uniref:Lipocalin/cytosolic fatty-acid binding domain-containing protein n=1 Tax=Amblyomma maculatum TaxID=34609 RepID=G3MLZ1_AMBMU
MSSVASLCAFLGFFFACTPDHETAVAFDTDAMKVLVPPHSYWLFKRSLGADTTFTGNGRCVEIEYVVFDDNRDMVMLDAREDRKKEEMDTKMYMASVKPSDPAVLQYMPLGDEANIGTVEYKVLEVMQNACYVVEKISEDVPEVSAEEGNEKVHKCELWLKKEKEVRHQRPTYTTQSLQACKKSYDVLCMNMQQVYFKRLCEPISPSK